jgi:hypothetical protein
MVQSQKHRAILTAKTVFSVIMEKGLLNLSVCAGLPTWEHLYSQTKNKHSGRCRNDKQWKILENSSILINNTLQEHEISSFFCWTYLINALTICTLELVWWAHCVISSQTAYICTFIWTIRTVFLPITCPCQRNTTPSTVTAKVCVWACTCFWQQNREITSGFFTIQNVKS